VKEWKSLGVQEPEEEELPQRRRGRGEKQRSSGRADRIPQRLSPFLVAKMMSEPFETQGELKLRQPEESPLP
jgi:hypothetical protein